MVARDNLNRFIEAAPRPFQAGDLVGGRYRLLARQGFGGMGEVWAACVDGPSGFRTMVALKIIHAELADLGNEEMRSMFFDEARLAGQLFHPAITQVHELGEDCGRPFIVMEYVHGLTVAALLHRLKLRGRRVPPVLAAHIAAALLGALDYAQHAQGADGLPLGVVHRDVCPQNVMCAYGSGAVKLLDFGIARAAGSLHVTQQGTVKGKVARMPVEQLTGGPVDGRTDIWAIGLMLYELLVGSSALRAPFDINSRSVNFRRIKGPPSAELPGLDPRFDAIVWRALQRDPELRYQTAAEMLQALAPLRAADSDLALAALLTELGEAASPMGPQPASVVLGEADLIPGAEPLFSWSQATPALGKRSRVRHRIPLTPLRRRTTAALAALALPLLLALPADVCGLESESVADARTVATPRPARVLVSERVPHETAVAPVAAAAVVLTPAPTPVQARVPRAVAPMATAAQGWLSVEADDTSVVTVDDIVVGLTPVRAHGLPVGQHRVRITCSVGDQGVAEHDIHVLPDGRIRIERVCTPDSEVAATP